MGELILILGGAKSGKTSFALGRCLEHPAPRIYLATAEARDEEMVDRIRNHQAERGPEWQTIEEPLDPAGAIRKLAPGQASILLLDCLTLWLSNLLAGQGLSAGACLDRTLDLAEAVAQAPLPVVAVGNEVGMGIVPENKLARQFRDVAGKAHQVLAQTAAEVHLIAAGLSLRLK